MILHFPDTAVRDDWTALFPTDDTYDTYDRRVIVPAQEEWESLKTEWARRKKSRTLASKDHKVRYSGKFGMQRFIYERSLPWFVHDCIFREDETWRLGWSQYQLCQFLQPIRNQILSMTKPADEMRSHGRRKYRVMATRKFMKTGVIRCLPCWVGLSAPRMRTRYSRDKQEFAADETGIMRNYLEFWDMVRELWPWLNVTSEKLRGTNKDGSIGRLKWQAAKWDAPILEGFDKQGDIIYGYRDTGDSTMEAGGVDNPPTGKRADLDIRDDTVSALNAHTDTGRKRHKKFINESTHVLAANGVVLESGTIHHLADYNAAQLKKLQTNDPKYDRIKPNFFYRPVWITMENGRRRLSYPEVLDWDGCEDALLEVGPNEFRLQYLLEPYSDTDRWYDYRRCMLWHPDEFEHVDAVAHSQSFFIICDPHVPGNKEGDTTVILNGAVNALRHIRIVSLQQSADWPSHEVEARLYADWFHWANHDISLDVSTHMENVAFIEAYRQSIEESAQEYDESFDIQILKTNTRTQSKGARMKALDKVVYQRRLYFKCKDHIDPKEVDTTSEEEMLAAIDPEQVPLYEDIRDAHGDMNDGGLLNDDRLDTLARFRQVTPLDSAVPMQSALRPRNVRQEHVTALIEDAMEKFAKGDREQRPSRSGRKTNLY